MPFYVMQRFTSNPSYLGKFRLALGCVGLRMSRVGTLWAPDNNALYSACS